MALEVDAVITVEGSADSVADALEAVGVTVDAHEWDFPAEGSLVAELGLGVVRITWAVRGTK